MSQFGIHWFRRDLRIAGNAALEWNRKRNQGKTLGVFFFDSTFLSRPDFSISRFGFFLQTLQSLRTELQAAGGDLLVIDQGPLAGFEMLLSKLGSKAPNCVTFSRDYEPFARERDHRVTQKLETLGIPVHIERDHLIIEPLELQKEPGKNSFYQIYTPFFKKWISLSEEDSIRDRIESQKSAVNYLDKLAQGKAEQLFQLQWKVLLSKKEVADCLDDYLAKYLPRVQVTLPKAGSLAAYDAVKSFQPKIGGYNTDRDLPAKPGTSRLSIYLKNGSITSALVLNTLKLNLQKEAHKEAGGQMQFLKEIVWREFYFHILYHRPSVEKEAFLTQYRNIAWQNNEKWFDAWKEGKTGFPIVDAGMRELKATGWMHNRVRMIVASFLTKDLLIDWRWGEQYFMHQLLDGDLAANNGGWQWAASTGCDPQPYFRIFNPFLQSKKFDPSGDYIRKYVPELRNTSAKDLHNPEQNYVTPIVDHGTQRQKALNLYKR